MGLKLTRTSRKPLSDKTLAKFNVVRKPGFGYPSYTLTIKRGKNMKKTVGLIQNHGPEISTIAELIEAIYYAGVDTITKDVIAFCAARDRR